MDTPATIRRQNDGHPSTRRALFGALAVTAALGTAASARADVVTDWSALTVTCTQGAPGIPANRPGPAGLLDIALVHAAVHYAVQAIEGRYEPYAFENRSLRGRGSTGAAAAKAAHATLVGLYGADDPCLAGVPAPDVTYAGDPGLVAGAQAAAALLPQYRPTITLPTDPFVGNDAPGQWRPTPGVTAGAGTFLAHTAPFALKEPAQFRPGPPPRLTSARYLRDFEEVKAVGSATNSTRTADETEMARFWSTNFFVQWNDALRGIALAHLTRTGDRARLLALTSFAAADSQISIYDAKYHYNYWRPITAIRAADDDGNPRTVGDPAWTPLIVTPPYPEYSSGASCLSAAITTVLEKVFDTDELPFVVRSAAPGVTVSPRHYERFSDATEEVVEARILQGIHFRTADEVGRRQGERIGRWTVRELLRPVRRQR